MNYRALLFKCFGRLPVLSIAKSITVCVGRFCELAKLAPHFCHKRMKCESLPRKRFSSPFGSNYCIYVSLQLFVSKKAACHYWTAAELVLQWSPSFILVYSYCLCCRFIPITLWNVKSHRWRWIVRIVVAGQEKWEIARWVPQTSLNVKLD